MTTDGGVEREMEGGGGQGGREKKPYSTMGSRDTEKNSKPKTEKQKPERNAFLCVR
jgi:hypothetical protein